jgi:hypothetical protein
VPGAPIGFGEDGGIQGGCWPGLAPLASIMLFPANDWPEYEASAYEHQHASQNKSS